MVRRLLLLHADNMKAETAAHQLAARHHMTLIFGCQQGRRLRAVSQPGRVKVQVRLRYKMNVCRSWRPVSPLQVNDAEP